MGISEAIKQSNFRSSRLKAHINIIYTRNWLRDIYAPIFKENKILEQHFNVLKIVKGSHPEKVSPGYILDVMLDKKRDLTRLVDKLVDLGYLIRNTNQKNRRRVEISISELGIAFTEKVEVEITAVQDVVNNITEEEAELLSSLLDKFRISSNEV